MIIKIRKSDADIIKKHLRIGFYEHLEYCCDKLQKRFIKNIG